MADVIVEITARNDMLRRKLLEAEGMVKVSATRMGNATNDVLGVGKLGSRFAKGGAALAALASIPSMSSMVQAIAFGAKGKQEQMDEAIYQVFAKLPIIGGFIDQAAQSIRETIEVLNGTYEETEKAERMRLKAINDAERMIEQREKQRAFGPLSVQTALGAAQIAGPQVFTRDSETTRLESLKEVVGLLKNIERQFNNLNLVVTQ